MKTLLLPVLIFILPMFSFLSLNARSLLNKTDELSKIVDLQHTPISIIAVCESWCNPSEPDSLYSLAGYTLYRCDRQNNRGGGVALYVNNSINHTHLSNITMKSFESLWVEVDVGSSAPVVVGCSYRPPKSDPRLFCHELERSIHTLHPASSNILILGDLNAKHQSWLTSDVTDEAGDCLSTLLDSYNLSQLCNFPTCITRGTPKSCLDLVITNLQSTSVSLTEAPPLGSSDHISILGQISSFSLLPFAQGDLTPPRAWSWCWETERLNCLKNHIQNINLLPDNSSDWSCDALWNHWRDSLLRAAHLYCTSLPLLGARKPKATTTTSSLKPWITKDLLNEIKLKHRRFRTYLQTRSTNDWEAFTAQRNRTSSLLRGAKSAFICRSASPNNSTGNINRPNLYKLMSCLNKQPRSDLPDLVSNGQVLDQPASKAAAFNAFFVSENQKSVGSSDEPIPAINVPRVNAALLTHITTTPEEVEHLLQSLDHTKSAGDDNIPTRLLKLVATQIAPSLSQLFNISFDRADQPQDWRDATVSPIHKKGPKNIPTNYRPISLLSVISKVQERIVHDRLYTHIDKYLPVDQSGFRKADGTELQLLRLVHEISAHRDKGQAVAACFFDLSKAFDRVWHRGLLSKLEHLGVRGSILSWFTSYLTKRRQRVRISGQYSDWLHLPAGVPQGSVLGPLLFLIYTVDLPVSCVNDLTRCSQFADDTAVIATHPNPAEASAALQRAVSSAATWLSSWHLLVNATKTVVMSFPAHHSVDVTLHGTKLQQVNQHRHLGLLFQPDLRWTAQLTSKIAKCRKSLHHLLRLRGKLNRAALSTIYRTYIRPIVEYGSLAMSNIGTSQEDILERLQRRAARICLRIPLFQPVHHSAILHHLEWATMSSRRKFRQLQLGHSIFYGNVPPHLSLPGLVQRVQPSDYNLRTARVFSLPVTRTLRHRDSPLNVASFHFNNLPQSLKSIKKPSHFRDELKPLILSSICACSQHP